MIQRLLKKELANCEFYLAMNKSSYQQALEEFGPQVILSDHALPQFNSSAALKIAKEKLPDIPFIMVTGAVSEEFAASIIIQGADDYILKDRMGRLPGAIKIALKHKQTEQEKKQIFKSLQENEEKYRTIMERVSDAFVALDKEWRYTYMNEKAGEIVQRNPKELIGKNARDEFPEGVESPFYHACFNAMNTQEYIYLEELYTPFNIWLETHIYPSPEGLSIFFRNTTERKESEEKLKTSEEKYRTLFYNSPLPSWIFDRKSLRFLDVNNAAIKHYGYTKEEFLKMTIKEIRPKDDLPALEEDIMQIKAGPELRQGYWRHLKKSGDLIVVETTAHSIKYDSTEARLVIANDITEKIKAEEEIRLSEIRLNEAQSITHIGSWGIDLVKNIHFWSDETYRIFGVNKNEAVPSIDLFLNFIHPDNLEAARAIINKALQKYTQAALDFRIVRGNGEVRQCHIEWRFEFDKEGVPVNLFGILQDVTDRKQAEENLRLLERKLTEQKIREHKKVARAIITGQEQERNHIGQELHDNINQILAGTKMYLSSAGNKSEEVRDLVKYPIELIDSSIEEIRLLCQRLVIPPKSIYLDELIHDLLIKLKENVDITTALTYTIKEVEVSEDIKLNIYRIVQEQINNIRKYAEAKHIIISIGKKGKKISILIKDDGKGFDTSVKRRGIGISNIIYRVESFNGKVSIKSSPGNGCKMTISIPL